MNQIKIKISDMLWNALYPLRCPICGEILAESDRAGHYACPSCIRKLSYIQELRCLKCGKPIQNSETEFCYDCCKVKHSFTQGAGVWEYTEEIKNSIYRFKYGNKREYVSFYVHEIKLRCESIIKQWDPDVLIPIPLHKAKQRKRGYNQAEIIAVELGKELNIQVDSKILTRSKKTAPQKNLNNKERVKNLENAFHITENIVKYKRVILIDDIYTTGTTADACTKVLLKAGAESVYCVSLCIGKGF